MSNKTYIYLVEDDKLFRELIHDYLEQNLSDKLKGVEIRKFSTGERVLKVLQEIRDTQNTSDEENIEEHIVVLDYKLSSVYSDEILNGLEVLQRVKSLNLSTQVIVVSAQEDLLVVDRLLEAGAVDYIVKNQNAFPRLLNSILKFSNQLNSTNKENKVLYQVVYRDDKKKKGRKKTYKRIAIAASTIALAELIFILFFS